MVATLEWTRATRKQVAQLDLNRPEDQKIYEQKLREFLRFNELHLNKNKSDFDFDHARRARDIGGKGVTISTGFNMSAAEAKKEWESIYTFFTSNHLI